MDVRGRLQQRRPALVVAAVSGLVIAALIALGLATAAWAGTMAEEERLLPGTVVAGVDVSGASIAAAVEAVSATLDDDLGRTLRLVHGEREWTVTPHELAVDADPDSAVRAAFERSDEFGLIRLAAIRWLGARANISVDASFNTHAARLGAFTRAVAADVDIDVRDAYITWNDGELELSESVTGWEVERQETIDLLRTAIADRADVVELPVTEIVPEVTTELAASALPPVRAAVEAARARTVTVTDGETDWRVSARDLDAMPVLDEILPAAYRAAAEHDGDELPRGHDLDAQVDLTFADDVVADHVAELAAHTDVPAVDASLDWSSGWIERVPGRDGLALDRERAADDIVAALRGAADTVRLEIGPATPDVTLDDLRYVLFLRQNERRLYLDVDGEITHEWPVAVGTAGQPTPTGEFRVGAKRFEPTWYNPAPTGWGRNMPRVVGPGPNNPLGLRALNWNRDGHDTLIRFHGTPNRQSIGQAASAGCVRMLNEHVIELFDLVPSGTAIVSIHGPHPEPDEPDDDDDDGDESGGDDVSDELDGDVDLDDDGD